MVAKTKVFIPDAHHPFQDNKALGVIIEHIHQTKPAEVIILGDFMDTLAPARWSRGLKDEYLAGLDKEAEKASQTLGWLRDYYDGPVSFLMGNHEARIGNYIRVHAPALAGIVQTIPELLRFKEYEVKLQPQPYIVAPGVKAIHGVALANYAGGSAMKEVERHGCSIVQGHSHRLGTIFKTTDKTRFGLECGWAGRIDKADYLPFTGVANWQQGFGVLHIDGSRVSPRAIPIVDGRIIGG